jgi:hypothetical protein
VIHLRKVDIGERPRYLLYKHVVDEILVVGAFHAGSPIPTLAEDESIELFPRPRANRSKADLFTEIAMLLAGKGPSGSHEGAGTTLFIPPKLTLVGLDEFDDARDADAAGDDAF